MSRKCYALLKETMRVTEMTKKMKIRARAYLNDRGIYANKDKELYDIALTCYFAGYDRATRDKLSLDIFGEEWRAVVGCEGIYEVSNTGRVRNISAGSFRVLTPTSDKHGYQYVNLAQSAGNKIRRIHRLVAQAFIPNPDNKPQVDHINGDPSNNNVNNLRWSTHKENSNNPVSRERKSLGSRVNTKNNWGKGCFDSIKRRVAQYTINGDKIAEWESTRAASRATGFSASHIAACAIGKRNSCHGYTFKYVTPESYTRIYKNRKNETD